MAKSVTSLEVLRSERVSAHLQRVVLGGPGLAAFEPSPCADSYVKLLFLADGVEYPEPFDLDLVRTTFPAEAQPVLRTYTVRHVDLDAGELVIEFVVHGDAGVAGPWAATVQPGARIHALGPGGGYTPDPEADVHLLVGDESALPAIAVSLEALPADAHAVVFAEVGGPEDEVALVTKAALDVHWLHRGDAEPGTTTLLDDAVRAWPWPEGRVQAFVHGESALLKTVRPYVRERVDRRDLSVSAYWRRGVTEEGFREWKHAQKDAVIRPERDA
jgi:NADPH-dependent ferric siderophore reductase